MDRADGTLPGGLQSGSFESTARRVGGDLKMDLGQTRKAALVGVALWRFAGYPQLHERFIILVLAEMTTTSTLALFESDHDILLVSANGHQTVNYALRRKRATAEERNCSEPVSSSS